MLNIKKWLYNKINYINLRLIKDTFNKKYGCDICSGKSPSYRELDAWEKFKQSDFFLSRLGYFKIKYDPMIKEIIEHSSIQIFMKILEDYRDK